MKPRVKEDTLLDIEGYCDADYAMDKDTRRSITGIIVYCSGVPICWRSRSQRGVTLSTTESEYYTMSELCSELLFIKQILIFLNISIQYPIIIRVDNVGAMFWEIMQY